MLDVEQRDGFLLARLGGEIDLANADLLEQRLERAVSGSSRVLVDLTAVEYIDSRGLRLLSRLAVDLSERDGVLELVAPPGSIARDVVDLTRMGDEIRIRDAVEG